jgi:hypothetical protein
MIPVKLSNKTSYVFAASFSPSTAMASQVGGELHQITPVSQNRVCRKPFLNLNIVDE